MRLMLKGAISRRGAAVKRPVGRQSLQHHSITARTPMASSRSATRLQIPHPSVASTTAITPLANDERKLTFESSAKRNCRVKMAFCTEQSDETGSSSRKTGAMRAMSGIA